MIIKDNLILRNLEEQVRKNMSDISDLTTGVGILGIKVVGVAETYEEVPLETSEDFAGLEYGDAFAVGTEPPYSFVVKTRANTAIDYDHWFNIGSIQGATGEPGTDGVDGTDGITPRLDVHYLNGEWVWVISYDNGATWTSTGVDCRGPVGPKGNDGQDGQPGPQGPRGDNGGFIHLAGVVATEAQLEQISPVELADLTLAYLVGTSQPYDLYVQVGETSETAVWMNQGQLNVATYVTVGGEFQGYWDADSKLDKVSTTASGARLYAVKGTGAQTMFNITDYLANNTVPYRKANGAVEVGPPTDNNDATNKQYVDTNLPQVIHW